MSAGCLKHLNFNTCKSNWSGGTFAKDCKPVTNIKELVSVLPSLLT